MREQFTLDADPLDGLPVNLADARYDHSPEQWRAVVALDAAVAAYREAHGVDRLLEKLLHLLARENAAAAARGV